MLRALVIGILLLMVGCTSTVSPKPITTMDAIRTSNGWWMGIKNENPNYYEEIDFLTIVIHLCGSRAKLWVEYNKRYPGTPFDLQSSTYMFTQSGNPIHIWLVVKVRDSRIVLHKWATGHELIRALTCYARDIEFLNAGEYR